jgi:protein-S-isoprenylcysteine O-methyltransferase Ste14
MSLRDALEAQGRWLFLRRSHLPLLLTPVFVAALVDFHYSGDRALDEGWEIVCLAIAFAGLGVRAATVGFVPAGTSGRHTSCQIAEELNTTGTYSIVRHPLYLGNAIITLGFTLFFRSWWLVAVVLLAFGLYYERIMLAEEGFLRERFGPAFEAWAARVPALLPNLRLWQAPALQFSWRTVVRREYHGAVGILAAFAGFRILGALIVRGHLVLDPAAQAGAVVAAVVFAVCRFLRKRTTLLHVPGR